MNKVKYFKKLIYVFLISLIAVFSLYYFIYSDIKSKNLNIALMQKELIQQAEKARYIKNTESKLDSTGSDIGIVKNNILSKNGEVLLLEEIESMARSNNLSVEVESISVGQKDEKLSNTELLKIRIRTKGVWLGSYRFIKQLESLSIKIKINQLSLINDSPAEDFSNRNPIDSWQIVTEVSVLRYK